MPQFDRPRHVADCLRESTRSVDWLARYGGEELCVVLPDTDLAHARLIAERIRLAISSQTFQSYADGDLQLTASLGVAELAAEDETTEDFVQRAGDRTRTAKQEGRNRVSS